MAAWRELHYMPNAELRTAQGALLQRHVRRFLYPFSPHYREVFRQAGVAPEQLRSVDDLRRLPLTSKQDLLPTEAEPQRFRQFLLQPEPATLRRAWPLSQRLPLLLRRWVRGRAAADRRLRDEFAPSFVTFTAGRSAPQVPFFYTQHDVQNLRDAGARLVDVAGLGDDLRIASVLPYGPHLSFWQVFFATQESGLLSLATGGGQAMGSAGDLQAITRLRAQALIGMPGYLHHLLRRAVAEGADLSSVTAVVLGPERVAPGQKEKLRLLLDAAGARDVEVVGTYGFTEARMMWTECPAGRATDSGYHLYPDLGIFEVIDPKTGEVVPEGDDGELVFTPLNARASAVFRYRTGDLVRGGIQYDPCPSCGRTVPRIASDVTRAAHLKEVRLQRFKDTQVNLEDCARLLSCMPEVEEWQIELRRSGEVPAALDELWVRVALRDGVAADQGIARVQQQFRRALAFDPTRVELMDLEPLLQQLGVETERQERRFVDARSSS